MDNQNQLLKELVSLSDKLEQNSKSLSSTFQGTQYLIDTEDIVNDELKTVLATTMDIVSAFRRYSKSIARFNELHNRYQIPKKS